MAGVVAPTDTVFLMACAIVYLVKHVVLGKETQGTEDA